MRRDGWFKAVIKGLLWMFCLAVVHQEGVEYSILSIVCYVSG